MAWYYVKSGGSATGNAGRYASEQSGSFATIGASGYYNNIQAAFAATSAPASGDYIMVSDAHSYSSSSTPSTYGSSSINTTFCYIVSVSDTDVTSYSAGATESFTNSNHVVNFDGVLAVFGITVNTNDTFSIASNPARLFSYESNMLNGTPTSGDLFRMNSDGSAATVVGGAVHCGDGFQVRGGGTITAYGVDIQSASALFNGSFDNGGGSGYFYGCDLTDITTLVSGVGSSSANDDAIDVTIKDCTLGGSFSAYADEIFSCYNHRLRVYNSAATSAAAEYQFYERGFGGEVEDQDDTGIHRNESTAFPSGTKVSAKATTSTLATQLAPFYFDLITATVDLSAAASDVITIYFASTATLTDTEVWAELIYPDGTNNHVPNFLSNRGTDVLATGTTHTDDSGSSTWKNGVSDLTAHNEYRMTLDTSGDAGADGIPTIRIYVGKASTTVYFDTTIGLS